MIENYINPQICQTIFDTFISLSNDGVLILDNKGKILKINNKLNKWLGYKPTDIEGLNLLQVPFLTLKTKKIVAEKFAQRILGQKVKPYQVELLSKSGEKVLALIKGKVISVANDKNKLDLVVLIDINAQSDIEKIAEQTEKKYQELFNSMSSGVIIYDVKDDGNTFIVSDINKSVEKMENTTRKKTIGQNITKLLPPDKRDHILNDLKSVWKTNKAITKPIVVYKNDQLISYNQTYTYKISNNQLAVIYDDLTAQKKAEESIKKNEAIYRSITESTQDSICLIDNELKYKYANKTHLKRLHKTLHDVTDKKYSLFHDKESFKTLQSKIKQIKESNKSISYEYQSQKDQNYFIRTISPIINDEIIEGYSIISKNISDQKQIQLKIQEQLDDMEKLNQLMVGRELKMIELKNEIKKLKGKNV